MKVEIVTHCLNYARLLSYQIGSLVEDPPAETEVVYTLFYWTGDAATCEVVERAKAISRDRVRWNWRKLPLEQLNRRAIGRNLAALETEAAWVWFADADYCFGRGCLDSLPKLAARQGECLLFPCKVQATSHGSGDRLVELANGKLTGPPRDAFTEVQRFNRAIGGVQIVRGDVCRTKGYLSDHPRWQRPVPVLRDFRDDVAFRRAIKSRGTAILLKEVYRIRHSVKGAGNSHARL